MQLRIMGQNYDIGETLSKPTLNDLYYLKVKTKSVDFPMGVSLKSMQQNLARFPLLEQPEDLLEDAELLLTLRAIVYLCRKHAGEHVTLDEANDFPLSELAFIPEEHDAVVTEAASTPPQARPDSAPAGGPEPAEASTESPTTSSSPSTATSASSPTSGQG